MYHKKIQKKHTEYTILYIVISEFYNIIIYKL